MKCKFEGCDNKVKYSKDQLCQTHYHRKWRNGHFELLREIKQQTLGHSRVYRLTMPGKGYQRLYEPDHPLRDKSGYVSEHRMVIYAKYGENLPPCELCNAQLNWANVHVDHINRDVKNNKESNLRPLCNSCNTRRDRPEEHTFSRNTPITFNGETKTAEEWGRDSRVSVTGHTIKRRLKLGMSHEEALFSPKITHNGKLPVKKIPKPKTKRKNAINLEIDGIEMTSMDWSRHPDCNVSDATLRVRVKAGWPHNKEILRRVKTPDKK